MEAPRPQPSNALWASVCSGSCGIAVEYTCPENWSQVWLYARACVQEGKGRIGTGASVKGLGMEMSDPLSLFFWASGSHLWDASSLKLCTSFLSSWSLLLTPLWQCKRQERPRRNNGDRLAWIWNIHNPDTSRSHDLKLQSHYLWNGTRIFEHSYELWKSKKRKIVIVPLHQNP